MQEIISQGSVAHDERLDSEDRRLLIASRAYASEVRWKSWWHLLSTLAVLIGLMSVVTFCNGILLRSACSLVIGLTLVRMFILYHDYLHQTIFKDSVVAGTLLKLYGHLMLTPPTIWRRTHDHHHRHNSKIFGASIGSFPVMTTSGYLGASRAERLEYRMARSVWIIVFGYFTVFLFGMCLNPLLSDLRRNLSVIGTLVLHFGAFLLSFVCMGASFTLFACVIPTYIAMLSGAYLFYIQHNFPQAQVRVSVRQSTSCVGC